MDDIITLNELRDRLRGVRAMEELLALEQDIYEDKEKNSIKKKNEIYLHDIYVLNDRIDNQDKMI